MTATIQITVPTVMPALPAAVEVAAYRLDVEALTNPVRHSGAGHCEIRLVDEDGLSIEI